VSATDEDVLLAAFYDRNLVEALRDLTAESDVVTTPLTELVAFLTSQRDIEHARVRFAGADMVISA